MTNQEILPLVSSLSFNPQKNCFSCAISNSFKVYNSNPFHKRFKRTFENKKINLIEMLGSSNILVLVFENKPNQLTIWDDYQSQELITLDFDTKITSAKLFIDKVVVCCLKKVIVYRFDSLEEIERINTCNNPKGLIAVTENIRQNLDVLAVPGEKKGEIILNKYGNNPFVSKFKTFDQQIETFELSKNGKLLGVCSIDGTLIRIFNCETKYCVYQFKRGKKKAVIFSMSFNKNNSLIAITSNRKSIHIFEIPADVSQRPTKVREKKGLKLGKYGLKKNRSMMKYQLDNICYNTTAFVNDEFIVVSNDGWYYRFSVNVDKKEIKQKEENHFVK
ncbi:wd-repeat protein interacting with phosphoinosides wipi -related [Anaeramoeba flamelloides]|uniref:Wd-repeat protein interacting with phosphoinosides wipi -related n=1 Tax=Anaeramoeba flamelloides TaxID=1746091 RepID=A0AAV7ZZT6_9EUKA|nr:wd-repeat protein interacting with phosphoinosides wipi -related [Anaeramoeba flamelloides]KAJ6243032.1 wd-repeat protein interacting with phosphoinosides wipi -related [Anaeramoeba flamelloides]